MKRIFYLILLLFVSGCHYDASSTLTLTVLNQSEDRQSDVLVQIKPANGGDADWLIDEKTTDDNGEARFLLEDWGNGSAWGTTVILTCIKDGDTLDIDEPSRGQLHVYQKGDEYNGEDYKEQVILNL